MSTGRPAVFLDRDGVLNHAPVVNGVPRSVGSVDELVVLPGVPEACATLAAAGLLLVVVTNQPDVARGLLSNEAVAAVNAALLGQVPVDHVYVCPHDDADCCPCRKPAPGLLVDAADRHGLDLGRSYLVGDRWRDIEAGKAAGCRTIHVDRDYGERRPVGADIVVGSLEEAVPKILAELSASTVAKERQNV